MGQNKKSHMSNQSEPSIHIRRCHVCGEVSESAQSSTEKCSHCGKFFAPFVFFDECSIFGLDDQAVPGQQALGPLTYYHELTSDSAEDVQIGLIQPDFLIKHFNERHHPLKTQYPPLWGLAVYW